MPNHKDIYEEIAHKISSEFNLNEFEVLDLVSNFELISKEEVENLTEDSLEESRQEFEYDGATELSQELDYVIDELNESPKKKEDYVAFANEVQRTISNCLRRLKP